MPTSRMHALNLPQGYQTILSNEKHGYLADEPADDGGTDLGFRPGELLLGSLATCQAMTIRFYARRQGWALEQAEVHCEMHTERAADGKTLTRITSQVQLRGDLTDEQRQRLLSVANRCPVHKILTGEMDIENAIFG